MACIEVGFQRVGGITANFEKRGGIGVSFSFVCANSLGEEVLFDTNGLVLTEAQGKILLATKE